MTTVHVLRGLIVSVSFYSGFSQDLSSGMWSILFHASPCI